MRICIILLFVVGIQNIVWSQEEKIVLQDEPVIFGADGFYVKEVVDKRENKENIGFVQKGVFKKTKVAANLEEGVEKSVFNFLKENFEQDSNGIPIVIGILELNISESSSLPVKGKAEVKMEFYKEKNGSLGKLYAAEAFVEQPAVNVTKTHEQRIREVISNCLENFNTSDWEDINPMYIKEERNN
ncbi:hypothetical protein [Maribellus maritimus]|uniref:hypothetical protein n=1 Tax=Maribellus maritimus TaxID=2870838 RepID=UPI001EE9FFE7|nr:hypothetical protein [Maribellus maritimus]MCG6185986.1 hypothetical protein [Maribellus maritimus]